MKRFLIAVGLLLSAIGSGFAFPLHGGFPPPTTFVCFFSGGLVDNSCISIANTSQQLGPDGAGFVYNFDTNCDALNPQNCHFIASSGGSSNQIGIGNEAVYKQIPNLVFWLSNYSPCGLWWQTNISGSHQLASAPGTLLGSGYFQNTTLGANYNDTGDLFFNARNGDSLIISTALHDCWPQLSSFSQTGMTITATGAKFGGVSSTKGMLVIGPADNGGGSNTTWDGGDFTGAVRIGGNASGVTLKNVAFHSACGDNISGSPTSCIEAGTGFGVLTLTNVTTYDGGTAADPGQYHNAYTSSDPTIATGEADVVNQINGLVSYNVKQGGWNLKMRSEGISAVNHITNSEIGCTVSSVSINVCEQNGAIDMPCGGRYLIDFSTIERGSGGDNYYLIRALEEDRSGSGQCPTSFAATNSFVFDHDIMIFDGAPTGWTVPIGVCFGITSVGGTPCSVACTASCSSSFSQPLPTITCTITNSVIVGNGSQLIDVSSCKGSGGAAVCSDGTNRCYISRTAAAVGEGWAGNDQFGNAFTTVAYLPPHM